MSDAKYITSNLLNFDTVMDMDMAVLSVLISKFKNTKYIRHDILNASTENVIKNKFIFRSDKNPLTVILKENYLSSADSLLNELYDSYYQDILNAALPNSIFRYIKTLSDTDIIISSINCKNENEKQIIKKFDKDVRIISNESNMNPYSCLFINYYADLKNFKNLGGKYIFVSNYRYNLDSKFDIKLELISLAGGYNSIRTIDPYLGISLPKNKGEMKNE